ncbi:MAG TPA: D-aminoacyl-tRNA deacylase [Chloroflexota bacterium]|jgi:D-tyrosyl-tRNA(Tyr) deacylase
MRAVLQRVTTAAVQVEGMVVGSIDLGWAILLGVRGSDTSREATRLAERVAQLRGFDDGSGRMNRSLLDVGGSALVISQITLYADVDRGRRPSFAPAAATDQARALVDEFCAALRANGVPVETGIFGANMQVQITNDGPVTFILDE